VREEVTVDNARGGRGGRQRKTKNHKVGLKFEDRLIAGGFLGGGEIGQGRENRRGGGFLRDRGELLRYMQEGNDHTFWRSYFGCHRTSGTEGETERMFVGKAKLEKAVC